MEDARTDTGADKKDPIIPDRPCILANHDVDCGQSKGQRARVSVLASLDEL